MSDMYSGSGYSCPEAIEMTLATLLTAYSTDFAVCTDFQRVLGLNLAKYRTMADAPCV
jgi:hypothetical protein